MHLVLLEPLAGGQVDRDHARLVVRAKHLGLMRLNVERGDVPGVHAPELCRIVSAAARRAIHSTPGWSVSPCAMTETNTASAAMLAIRPASGAAEPSTNRANVIVATPFGPNQAMNALPAVSTWRVPASATNTATGRADQQREGHDRHRGPAVLEQRVEGEDARRTPRTRPA